MSNRFGDRFREAYRDTRRWWERDDRDRDDARERGMAAWGDEDRYGYGSREPRGYGIDRPRGYEYDEGRERGYGEREQRFGRMAERGYGYTDDLERERDRDRDRERDAEIERERQRFQQMRSREEWSRSRPSEHWREDFDRDRWREGMQAQVGYGGSGIMVGPDPAGRYWYRGRGTHDERFGGPMRDIGREGGHSTIGQRMSEERRRIGMGPKGYKRSDERIRDDLCDTLCQAHDLDASDVEVKVQSGEVILTGTVPERHMKLRIEQFADHIPGVVDVNNQIRVKRMQREAQQQHVQGTRQYDDMEGNGRRPAGATRS